MAVTFDIKAIGQAIKSCEQDIPLKYGNATTLNAKAMERLHKVEMVLFNLGLRTLASGQHSPLGDTPQTWTELENYFATFPENFRSAEEQKLNLLLLKSVFDLPGKELNMPGWKREKVDKIAECIADTLAYSEENTVAFLDKKLEISSADIGRWLYRAKSFIEIVAFLKTTFHLKSKNKSTPASGWALEMFDPSIWQTANAKPFWNLLAKRIVTPEDSLMTAIKLVINSRPHQLRIYRLTKVTYDGIDQELGMIDCLLIDGKTVNWQIAERMTDGGLERDTELLDLYFAKHKSMRLTPTGVLSVIMKKEDTTSQIEKETLVEFHLHFENGPQDFCTLLETRGAILTASKQSAPKQSVDVSSGDAVGTDPPVDLAPQTRAAVLSSEPGKSNASFVQQKEEEEAGAQVASRTHKGKHYQRDVRKTFNSSIKSSKNSILPQDRIAAADSKSSQPTTDINANPAKGEVTASGTTTTSAKTVPTAQVRAPKIANALVAGEERQKSAHLEEDSRGHGREASMSLTPLPSERSDVELDGARCEITNRMVVNSGKVPVAGTHHDNSTTRKSSRTYSKANKRAQLRNVLQEDQNSSSNTEKESIVAAQNEGGGRQSRIEKALVEESTSHAKPTPPHRNARSTTKVLTTSCYKTNNVASQAVETDAVKANTGRKVPATPMDKSKEHCQSVGLVETGQRELRRSVRVSRGTVNSTQGRKPKIQADLFYDQPQVAPEPKGKGEGPKTTNTAARDVRFSSPLENIPSNGTTSREYRSRPSLKARHDEDKSYAQSMNPAMVQSLNVVSALQIVVQAPSTVTSSVPDPAKEHAFPNLPESHEPFSDSQSDISDGAPEADHQRKELPTNQKESQELSITHASTLKHDEAASLMKHLSAEAVQQVRPIASIAKNLNRVRGSRATIDDQLEADLRDIANGNQALTKARKAAKDRHSSSRIEDAEGLATTVDGAIELRDRHTSADKQEERFELDRALDLVDQDEMDKMEPVKVPDLTKTRKKKRSAIEVPDIHDSPPQKKSKRKNNSVSARNPLREESLKVRGPNVEHTDFMEVDPGDDLTNEELSMREMVRKIYKVTWETARQTMQVPERECSVAQERLQALVLEVLQDAFADTQDVISAWQTCQQRCHATIVGKVIPALRKLEDEKNLAFQRLRGMCEIWNARRIQIPEEILVWVGDS
ncbi:hypothetical protein QFC22_001902 [Naganishia vaughanmartiniae]|uniref:Uncharacterized protein n=1 Tax=Naganishia vaughanmartiniae TaxID=1424756 RepID=A0ACC2XGG4_9TREE|nr:hypothetical protein QFC22_001902 [Naganishia vaughanmartiniae]